MFQGSIPDDLKIPKEQAKSILMFSVYFQLKQVDLYLSVDCCCHSCPADSLWLPHSNMNLSFSLLNLLITLLVFVKCIVNDSIEKVTHFYTYTFYFTM